jgi:hypothetical protein|tara:strand:- start:147 stop:332 length:186 start_codon:yes stop_codon:yes gene_type:complete
MGDDVMANLYDNMRKAKKKRKRGKKTAGVKSKTYNQMKNKTGPFRKKKTSSKKKKTTRRKK